jgi:hypothetical protein
VLDATSAPLGRATVAVRVARSSKRRKRKDSPAASPTTKVPSTNTGQRVFPRGFFCASWVARPGVRGYRAQANDEDAHLIRFIPTLRRTGVAALLALAGIAAQAQGFANKMITMVVPYPADGPSDLITRPIQPDLTKRLGQSRKAYESTGNEVGAPMSPAEQ